jgi:mannose-1-phosphate guanylyltransferase
VVLVGGFGTRLRPLTDHVPKQMLPVGDRPMLWWVVAQLARHGIGEAVLSLGYRPDVFEAAFPDGACAGVRLHYAVEPEPLDTGGAIRFAADQAGIDDRFVVLNGDVLTDLDISDLVAFHEARGAEATIALHEVDDPSRFGVVDLDPDGRVRAFVEKPPPGEAPTNMINAGVYVFEPAVLERIPMGRRVSVERTVFPAVAADGGLFGRPDGGAYWLDTGTPDQYVQAQLDALEGRLGETVCGVSADAVVSPSATVRRSVVLAGASIGDGAEVIDSAVLAGASVGVGARLLRSVVGPGARVGVDAVLAASVLGDGAVVDDGSSLEGARVPEPG